MSSAVGVALRDHYRGLLGVHGDSPSATQMSLAGKHYRYQKLLEIADLDGASVLDVGCGLGEMVPVLRDRYPSARYHGVDLVPETIVRARELHPAITFEVADVAGPIASGRYDYVLMSALFNNATDDPTGYLESTVTRAWQIAERGLGFNFLPIHVNFVEPTMAYHDPARVLDFCLRHCSRSVRLEHHYERCDVAVFVYR